MKIAVCFWFLLTTIVSAHTTPAGETAASVTTNKDGLGLLRQSLPSYLKGDQGEQGTKDQIGRSWPGSRGQKDKPDITKRSPFVASSPLNEVPHCNRSNRGVLQLTEHNGADMVVICRKLSGGSYKWTHISSGDTDGQCDQDLDVSSCYQLMQRLQERNCPVSDGLYRLYDSYGSKALVYCDMSTAGGGWQLIGKVFQPKLWHVPSTSRPITMSSEQGWYNRFSGIAVNDFRVRVSTSYSLSGTKAHWYYHFENPRPLFLLYSAASANNCGRTAIWGMQYTFDVLSGRRYYQHRCSRSQDSTTPMNGCFSSGSCPSPENDGSFSFHGTLSKSGQDDFSTAFFGCDDGNCCACWGPTGGRLSYCSQNCQTENGGTLSHTAYAWFYIR